MRATKAKKARMPAPASALRLPRRARNTSPIAPASGRVASAVTAVWSATMRTSSPILKPSGPLARAWIEPGGQENGRHHRHQHGDRDQEKKSLHQREVFVVNRLQEEGS